MRPFLKGVHADDSFMPRFKPDSLQCKACGNYVVMMLDEQLRKTELAAVKKNEQMLNLKGSKYLGHLAWPI